MRIKKTFSADQQGVGDLVSFTGETLEGWKVEDKNLKKALHCAEEAAGSLIDYIPEDEKDCQITAVYWKRLGTIGIELIAPGREYSPADNMASARIEMDAEAEEDTLKTIRNIMLRSMASDLKYKNRDGKNHIRMILLQSRHAFLFMTLGAMILAIIIGFIFSSALSADVCNMLNSSIFEPVKTLYMDALKMVVAPVVFFSIISCIIQFSDLSALGRIGAKVFGLYLITTVIASFVGVGMFYLFQPGSIAMAKHAESGVSAIASQASSVSVADTIMGIIPTNIVDPFLKSNMLQLIFMAILFGIATAMLGKYVSTVKELLKELNDIFLRVTTMIIKVMPIAVFCSIMSMMLTMGIESLISVLGIVGTFILGLICMMIVYCMLMVVVGRMNPLPFLRKYAPVMIQVFSMASSNASIPVNMEACDKKLGIDRKIYSLSIPLGATVNMDGTCVHMAVFALALAKIYGVELSAGAIASMIFSIIVLSVGAPGIPGSGLICLSVLLTQIGVPVEALGLVMGIDSFIGMFRCMSNCLGDVAVSTVVAKSEGLLNQEVYRS